VGGGGGDDVAANAVVADDASSYRCQYARTCEGTGLLLPFIFCKTSILSTSSWMMVLSLPLLLALTLLFRLLGSTADEYFSPSLEMFSIKLGLPPRFAGVTLLALGNGASDVSATFNAIWNDPIDGYKMSLGALTGASMFVTTVVAGSVVVTNGGMVCRGALLRDVMALGITVLVVASTLEEGTVGPGVSFAGGGGGGGQ
jgi:Ca2+/Na+ antiporter